MGYTRVSTEEQATSGLGLEAQERSIAQYSELYKLKVSKVISDRGASGKDLRRPGVQQVLELLRSGQASGVIVAKLDRLTRSVRDIGELVETYFIGGRRLVSVSEQIDTSTASGRLVLNVLSSVNQWEREAIGERTKAALASKKKRGERAGHIPFGYELDPKDPARQKLRPCEVEQRAIREAIDLAGRGTSTYQIADILNRLHPKASRSEGFTQSFVWKLLKRRREQDAIELQEQEAALASATTDTADAARSAARRRKARS